MQDKATTPLHTPRMRRLAPGLWLVESTSTPGIGHKCTVDACGCKAGQYGRMCRHRRLVRQAEAWYGAYDAIAASAPVPAAPVAPTPAPVPHAPGVQGDWYTSAAYRALADCFE